MLRQLLGAAWPCPLPQVAISHLIMTAPFALIPTHCARSRERERAAALFAKAKETTRGSRDRYIVPAKAANQVDVAKRRGNRRLPGPESQWTEARSECRVLRIPSTNSNYTPPFNTRPTLHDLFTAP